MRNYSYNVNSIGINIKWRRNYLSMSQQDLANSLGVDVSTISKWENGITQPRIEELVLLSNVLGVSLSSLMEGNKNDFVALDLYFNNCSSSDLENSQNIKRFVDSYAKCRQKLNDLIRKYLLSNELISFDEFEMLSKALMLTVDVGDILIVHKIDEKFDLTNADFKYFNDDKKILSYQYNKNLLNESEGTSKFFIEENEHKAYCEKFEFNPEKLFITRKDLVSLKILISRGLLFSDIKFSINKYSDEHIFSIIGNDNYLLELFLECINLRNLKMLYGEISKKQILSQDEKNIFIKTVGKKALFGDDIIA